jgi:hypothetical protein
MQTTMLMLLALITSQVGGLGDRYPEQPAAEEAQTDASKSPAATAEDSTTESAPGASESTAEEPATSNSNFFDEIDAAQPLSKETAEDSATARQAESTPQISRPDTSALGIQPSFSAQGPTATAPETETDPAKVLAGMLETPLEGALTGTKLTLAQAVDNALSRADQTQRVVAYWDLSQAVADYYLAYKERTELAALRQGISLPSPDWETARANTEARLQLATDRVHAAQAYLGAVTGNTTPGFAPLPADVPFCGPYETRYAQLFQSRSSALAEQLNELLPRLHSELLTCTVDIAEARKWMFTASDRRGLQSDGNELLKAYLLFTARRQQFLDAVREYNIGIVRYTETATPGTVETERLVAMLIRTGSSPQTTFDTDVQRANAEEGAGLNDSSSSTPAAGWGSTKQTSTERSILVPRG